MEDDFLDLLDKLWLDSTISDSGDVSAYELALSFYKNHIKLSKGDCDG